MARRRTDLAMAGATSLSTKTTSRAGSNDFALLQIVCECRAGMSVGGPAGGLHAIGDDGGSYGDGGDDELTEATPAGTAFLAETCKAWENAALGAATRSRVVLLRTGIVLGRKGGALRAMAPIFRIGLGGR